jgi:hypothetical protein
MPSLEVESDRARSTCCKTCSKEQLHTATAGFFMPGAEFKLMNEARRLTAFLFGQNPGNR